LKWGLQRLDLRKWFCEGLGEAVGWMQKGQEGQKRQKSFLLFCPFCPFCISSNSACAYRKNFCHELPARGVSDSEATMNGAELILMDCQSDATAETVEGVRLSFDDAFVAHHRVVYRYAYALTRDPGLAEDIAQEVFVRLHQHLDAAQRDGLLRAWLLRVTANVSRNAVRGRLRARSRDESFVARMLQATAPARPDDELLRQVEISEARRALAKIKEPMRSCLLLKHEGLSYKEIAAALGVNESNVGSLIARARREFVRVYAKIGKS
jgi:RNA polymerase sigma factor (sigma-70 family)